MVHSDRPMHRCGLEGTGGRTEKPRGLKLIWKFKVEGEDVAPSDPAISGNYIYVGSIGAYGRIQRPNGPPIFIPKGNGIYCLNKYSGNLVWKFDTGDDVMSPIISENYVHFYSGGYFWRLNKDTGKLKSKFKIGDVMSFIMSGDYVFFLYGGDDGYVCCVNKNNGELVWRVHAGIFLNKLAISGNYVYISSVCHVVFCLNKNNGEFIWDFETGWMVCSSPVISENYVYVADMADDVYCLNKNSGELIWKCTTEGGLNFTGPIISENYVYFNSRGGYVYCLNKYTGKLKWKFRTGGVVPSSPAISENYIYISSSDGYVYCLNKITGELAFKFETRTSESTPVISGNYLYISSRDGYIYAFDIIKEGDTIL